VPPRLSFLARSRLQSLLSAGGGSALSPVCSADRPCPEQPPGSAIPRPMSSKAENYSVIWVFNNTWKNLQELACIMSPNGFINITLRNLDTLLCACDGCLYSKKRIFCLSLSLWSSSNPPCSIFSCCFFTFNPSRVTGDRARTGGQGLAPVTRSRAGGLRRLLLGHHYCCQTPFPSAWDAEATCRKFRYKKARWNVFIWKQ